MIDTIRMNRELLLEQHIIEAWGLWWVQWQKDCQSTLRKRLAADSMSNRVNRFTELHLLNDQEKVLGGVPKEPPAPILPIKNCIRS